MTDRRGRTAEGENGTRTSDEELRIVDPNRTKSPNSRTGPVIGVVLAAGTSTRFGAANKLLAELDGGKLVRRVTATLCDAAVDEVVVIVGHEAKRVREALAGLDVSVVANPEYEAGQSTSVRAGVRAARERDASAVVVALGDMPGVEPATVDALVEAYRADAADALAAAFEGERGNPVLFDRRFFDELQNVSGDTGGRRILLRDDRAALVETGDPGVLRDVDTEADLDERSTSRG